MDNWIQAAVAGMLDATIGTSEVDCPLYKPFNGTLDNSSLSEQNKYVNSLC